MLQKQLRSFYNNIGNKTYCLNEKIEEAMNKNDDLIKFQVLQTKTHKRKKLLNKKSILPVTQNVTNNNTLKAMNIYNYDSILSQKEQIYQEEELTKKLLKKLKHKSILNSIPKKRKPITSLPFKFQIKMKQNASNTYLNTLETSRMTNASPFSNTQVTRNEQLNYNQQYSKTVSKSLFALSKRINTEEKILYTIKNDLYLSKQDSYSFKKTKIFEKANQTTNNIIPKYNKNVIYTFPRVTQYIIQCSKNLYAFRDAKIKLFNKYKYNI